MERNATESESSLPWSVSRCTRIRVRIRLESQDQEIHNWGSHKKHVRSNFNVPFERWMWKLSSPQFSIIHDQGLCIIAAITVSFMNEMIRWASKCEIPIRICNAENRSCSRFADQRSQSQCMITFWSFLVVQPFDHAWICHLDQISSWVSNQQRACCIIWDVKSINDPFWLSDPRQTLKLDPGVKWYCFLHYPLRWLSSEPLKLCPSITLAILLVKRFNCEQIIKQFKFQLINRARFMPNQAISTSVSLDI